MHTVTSEEEEQQNVPDTGFCDQCRSSCRISNNSNPSDNGLSHDVGRDWAILKRNADSGCDCCRLVVEWFRPAVESTPRPGSPRSEPVGVNTDCTLSVSEHSRLSVHSLSHKRPVELFRLEPYLDHGKLAAMLNTCASSDDYLQLSNTASGHRTCSSIAK